MITKKLTKKHLSIFKKYFSAKIFFILNILICFHFNAESDSNSSPTTTQKLIPNNLQEAIYQVLFVNNNDSILAALKYMNDSVKYANLKTDLQNNNINATNEFQDSILILASTYNFTKLVEGLLQIQEIDINHKNRMGNTALHWAVESGNIEVVKLLLSHPNIDPNIKNNNNETAINLAQKPNRTNLLSIITNYSKDLDRTRELKKHMLLKVLKRNKSESPIELDPNTNFESDKIILSIQESDPIFFPHLQKIKDDFINNIQLKWYWNLALSDSATDSTTNVEIPQYLSEIETLCAKNTPFTNIDINKTHQFSNSSMLIRAAFHGYANIIKKLIEVPELKINYQRPNDGRRALDAALIKGNLEIAKLLLSRKDLDVDYRIISEDRQMLIDYVKNHKFFEILLLIEKHPNFKNQSK
ncbi:MAG: ankyrin repeat domain-containing protein [Oligoflexia bacterium]|nr:ankyrin repeat domain-containing protein [Oligoflexia bacterium]